MQINDRIKIITPENVVQIRKKLRRGDGELIAEMLDGLYKPNTINRMIWGHRTMKPIVFDAAKQLVQTIENLKKESK